jgi:D-glycero-D-manno-heptose 1,7-bisphosphate phosphatase
MDHHSNTKPNTDKLIILDRDGVINTDSVDYVKSPEEWIPIPGSLEAIARLNQAGYKVAIATNQSGVARGLYDLNMLDKIHEKMQKKVHEKGGHIDGIFFCPHGPDDQCNCRKPKPGLLEQIEQHFNIKIKNNNVPCIGDSLRDLEAGYAIGAKPILVLTGNGQDTAKKLPPHLKNIPQYPDLASATQALLT